MKYIIPNYCYVRWQAALAVLEDLREDIAAPFDMREWARYSTKWEAQENFKKGELRCGTAACFAGYISVAPYCKTLGYPERDNGYNADRWLLGKNSSDSMSGSLFSELFSPNLNQGERDDTLAFLERKIKRLFRNSTGNDLVAPLTFYY